MNTNIEVIGLTRLEIKSEFTAPKADVLTTWPSELFNHVHSSLKKLCFLDNDFDLNCISVFHQG